MLLNPQLQGNVYRFITRGGIVPHYAGLFLLRNKKMNNELNSIIKIEFSPINRITDKVILDISHNSIEDLSESGYNSLLILLEYAISSCREIRNGFIK